MTGNNKINKVEELALSEVKELMINLIKSLGYSEIQVDNNAIIAVNKSPLSSEKFLFILLEQRLSGNVNIEEIRNTIAEYQDSHVANVVYIVSEKNISSGFEKNISQQINHFNLNFIGRDRLIELINEHYNDFWKHKDLSLIEYEKYFCDNLLKDSELKKLKIFNDKYQKLLDIYIEPRIMHFYEDKTTQTPVRKRVSIDDIIKSTKPIILSGDAGAGKSTFLKKIGEQLIALNVDENTTTRNIPVYISAMEIYEENYNIESLVLKKLSVFFGFENLSETSNSYNIFLLIDSIDEFSEEEQRSLLRKMHKLSEDYKLRYVVSSRNSDKMESLSDSIFESYHIEKFNTEQVKKFISKFFLGENAKTESLLEALKENRIIERLPITPLTLSLISILYEENNLEIPATIADIYDNFNSLIIGRLTVSSKIEFVDISFKERILSLYALLLLEKENHTPLRACLNFLEIKY